MGDLDWGDFFDDFSEDSQVVNNEAQAQSSKDLRDKEYTELVQAYKNYYTKKSNTNIKLRVTFFILCFIFLAVLISACLATAIYACKADLDRATFLTTLLTSIIGAISSILILPTIICNYLFPKDEDQYIRDLICRFKDSDERHDKDNDNKKQGE